MTRETAAAALGRITEIHLACTPWLKTMRPPYTPSDVALVQLMEQTLTGLAAVVNQYRGGLREERLRAMASWDQLDAAKSRLIERIQRSRKRDPNRN